jgi:hypothetical protein
VIVDYADAVAAFFVPRQEDTVLPVAVAEGSPARRLRDACEPVAMHAVWSRTTNERLAQLGLDFLTSYVGGRGACMGDPAGVAAAAAAGLDPVEMNILTELWIGMPLLSYTATRGWAPEVMHGAVARLESRGWVRDGGLTGEGLAERLSIEQHTDAQEQPIVAALGGRLEEVCDCLNHWGQLCIEAGAFPPDILKRAAG